jgi:hypothetical protein
MYIQQQKNGTEITVQGEKVSLVKSIKFISLQLNSTLDWEDEINAIVKKCENLHEFHDLCEAHLVEAHNINFNEDV